MNKNNLEDIRTDKLMTQVELAKLSGISKTSISLIENGYQEPTTITRKKLCNALEATMEAVFPKGE